MNTDKHRWEREGRVCRISTLVVLLLAMLALGACGAPAPSPTAPSDAPPMGLARGLSSGAEDIEADLYAKEAPELPPDLDWLNVDRPLALSQLRGKVVLIDFWTYGCINCIHELPDLKRLQDEFPDELVVIGIHSPKFLNEQDTENVRQVILRYGIEHPIANDPRRRAWYDWGIEAWPTLVLIDPLGSLAKMHVGEGGYAALRPLVTQLVRAADARGTLDRTPIAVKLEREGLPETVLSFPGGILADPAGGRLFVADTNHRRIVVADIASGEVHEVIGSGRRGFEDGEYGIAAFAQPQGMALSADGRTLYVADTENHAVRQVDLVGQQVTTLAGTGAQAPPFARTDGSQRAAEVALSSPWDLALEGGWLYVSMIGTHQVWRINLEDGRVSLWAGSGIEGAIDGLRADAELAQPSGLALDGAGRLYFADAESSAIRWGHVDGEIEWLGTLVGGQGSLFAFGDVDGVGDEVRLQRPLGVAYDADAGVLYVADTYNHKIKRLDPEMRRVDTYLGSERGWRDGADPLFYEPSDLDLAGGQLYVADTNNHAIRVIDLQTGEARTLALRGIERLLPEKDVMPGDTVSFDPVQIGAGAGQVVLDVELPPGHKLSELARSAVVWHVEGGVVALPGADGEPVAIDALPLQIPVTFEQGEGELVGDLFLGYCRTGQEGICLLEQARLRVPVTVGGTGEPVLRIVHRVALPDFGRSE